MATERKPYQFRRYVEFKYEFLEYKKDIFKSGRFIDGPYSLLLKENLKDRTKYPYVVLTNSGTTSLFIIAEYYSQWFNKILTSPVSFKATYNAFKRAGYTLVYTEVDKWLMGDYSALNDYLNLSVGLLGKQPDLNSDNFNIEDACQSWINSPTSNTKTISFDPTKNVFSCGNGGAILTHSKRLASFAEKMIRHDESINGLNMRMSELEAAFVSCQFPYIDKWQEERKERALELNKVFKSSLFDNSPNHDVQKYVIHKSELSLAGEFKSRPLYPTILKEDYYQLFVF